MASHLPLTECPQTATLHALISGSLAEEEADLLLDHLNSCHRCARQADELAQRSDSLIDAMRRNLPNPSQIDQTRVAQLIANVAEPSSRRPSADAAALDESVDLEDFVTCLKKSGLIHASEVELLVEQHDGEDSRSFARYLIARKKLTRFQARALLHGKWKGLVLGNYVIEEKLGEGGMGHVFKARHRRMGRVVCLKLLRAARRNSPELVQRFRREAQTAGALNHPNIVVAHDADETAGIPFLVTEFIDGPDLARLINEQGARDDRTTADLVLQTAQALDYAHQQGVIHRDVKPHNLLLDPTGSVKVLDLGLARFDALADDDATRSVTRSGILIGTVDYMSPEQALNCRHAQAASDVYSLGATLHFLRTGRVMYDGETVMEKLIAHREQPAPPLEAEDGPAASGLEAIYQKMVAKRPADRYASMAELVADLERFQRNERPLAQQASQLAALPAPIALASTPPDSRGSASTPTALPAPLLLNGQPNAPQALPMAPAPQTPAAKAQAAPRAEATASGIAIDVGDPRLRRDDSELRRRLMWTVAGFAAMLILAIVLVLSSSPPESGAAGDDRSEHTAKLRHIEKRTRGRSAAYSQQSALIVLPQGYFYDAHFKQLTASLKKRGLRSEITAARKGTARPKHGSMKPVRIYRPLNEISNGGDYSLVVFVGGAIDEFSHKGPGEKDARRIVRQALSAERAVAGIGNATGLIDEHLRASGLRAKYEKEGHVEYGKIPNGRGMVLRERSGGCVGDLVRIATEKLARR